MWRLTDDAVVRKTTLREVKVLRQVQHPNVVALREAFKRRGKLYLVFEFVDRNLLEVLEENPRGLPPDLVQLYIYQLCKAICWCHSHNVIHRGVLVPVHCALHLFPLHSPGGFLRH